MVHSHTTSMTPQHTQQQLRYPFLFQPNMPGHAAQARGRQADSRAGVLAAVALGQQRLRRPRPHLPPWCCSHTESVGAQFRSRQTFGQMSSAGWGSVYFLT